MNICEMLARNSRTYPNDTAVIELTLGNNLRRETNWKEMTKDELLEWRMDKFPVYERPRRIELGDMPSSSTDKILRPDLRLRYGGKKIAF